ncbi:MAG: UDP-3-O-(3-hydroxymyristoyl)glucosamine N-acyltransferase [Verrucomicrobiales bacterium]|nr:UDP-3-O-(3-hydroxymyristoyl)glucosamine N-acyltransferase [Verrucomicrobiales bacterium]
MKLTLLELVELVGGELLQGQPDLELSGFESLKNARPCDVSFLDASNYAEALSTSKAGVAIISQKLMTSISAPETMALVVVENAARAFDKVVRKYGAPTIEFRAGIDPSAVIGEGAKINADKVEIGPNAVIGAGVVIGDGSSIGACATVGLQAVLGEDCKIAANVAIREGSQIGNRVIIHSSTVVGADGFGFEFNNGRHEKVEQLGIVRIEDDVEIGACTTIDRARFGETVIGAGTKIDNHVQIAHNVVIGKHCIIVSQTGIAGTCVIGDYVTMAAQVGIAPHVEIGSQAVLGGGAKVISDLEGGQTYFGYPAVPMKEELRSKMHLKRLAGLFKRVKKLEQGD